MPEETPTEVVPEPGAPDTEARPVEDLAAAEVERLKEALRAAEAREADMRERLLRLQADFDNFRKRTRKEAEESRKYASEKIVRELLEVLGNFDRAISTDASAESLRAGLELIARQFRGVLEREGVLPIPAEGQPFDPALHEAIAKEPADGVPEGTVVREYERGYTLHGKVVRPAKVAVASNA